MGLADIVRALGPEPELKRERTLEEEQAIIVARVTEAVERGDDYAEVPVPFGMFVTLQAWVESEGMLCGSHQQAGRRVSLIVWPRRAPVPPAAPDEAPPAPDEVT